MQAGWPWGPDCVCFVAILFVCGLGPDATQTSSNLLNNCSYTLHRQQVQTDRQMVHRQKCEKKCVSCRATHLHDGGRVGRLVGQDLDLVLVNRARRVPRVHLTHPLCAAVHGRQYTAVHGNVQCRQYMTAPITMRCILSVSTNRHYNSNAASP